MKQGGVRLQRLKEELSPFWGVLFSSGVDGSQCRMSFRMRQGNHILVYDEEMNVI